jgi:type IV secretory pathway TraG/TraD family ATPase VirD4
VRLFTDPAFQKIKLANVKNPVVRAWREKTYGSMGDKEKQEMIPYFQAKFGAFTTTPLLRNIIGQPKSSFEISDIMDKGKFLIMNLSKGKMGDINANLLGMMIVSQIRLAAFRRAFIDEKDRVPHFLYIDEFQNFITPSIESILSEARKYRLGIVIAHQYLEQLAKPGL